MNKFDFNKAFEKIMNGKNLTAVVLLAHINPDGDAAGSVMGLAHYLYNTYPSIRIIPFLSDKMDKGPRRVVSCDSVFSPFEKPQLPEKTYGVIVCDTATRERIAGREWYEGAAASIVLDHHASNEGYGDVNDTKISESCSENIFYLMDRENLVHAAEYREGWNAAEYIYMGMIHDTDGFDRADAGLLDAASALMRMGVSHSKIMKTLKTETYADFCKRLDLMKNAVRVMDGKISYAFVDGQTREEKGISYEDIHPVSGLLRDCEDIELGCSFFEEEPGLWRCSFRSDGEWINVNELMKPFGGGGHAGAAGLRKKTDHPEKLVRDILERVEEMRKSKIINK